MLLCDLRFGSAVRLGHVICVLGSPLLFGVDHPCSNWPDCNISSCSTLRLCSLNLRHFSRSSNSCIYISLNTNKTKYMIITKNNEADVTTRFYANTVALHRVENLNCLGCFVNDQWNSNYYITIFLKMQDVFACNTSLSLRMRIVWGYV